VITWFIKPVLRVWREEKWAIGAGGEAAHLDEEASLPCLRLTKAVGHFWTDGSLHWDAGWAIAGACTVVVRVCLFLFLFVVG
jgi:hypothetical protein